MARLRVRMEMNQGGMGVPLHKLVGVAGETHRFFNMLCEDIRIDTSKGEWLALDFDETSLSFTVEYVGPLNPEQVREFYDAFSGSTPLRKATIGQFARIADSIDEDEMIGFGFFHGDDDAEPHEWRSLSRRDALRIGEEMRTLAEAMEQNRPESLMPQSAGLEQAASYFRERRDHGPDRTAVETFLRAVEARLMQRITRLESEVAGHAAAIQTLKDNSAGVEHSMKHLLAVVEDFCDRASQQFARLPAATAVSGATAGLSLPAAPASEEAEPAPAREEEAPEPGGIERAAESDAATSRLAQEPAAVPAMAAAAGSGPAGSGDAPTVSGPSFFPAPAAPGSTGGAAYAFSAEPDEAEFAAAGESSPPAAGGAPQAAATGPAAAAASEPLPGLQSAPGASRGWMWGVAAAAVVLVAGVLYGIGAFEPRAVPAEGAGPKAAPVAEKPAETAVPVKPPAQAGAIPASVSVRLRAAESCWVTVSVGEKPAYTGVLEAGQTKTFEASEPIRVRTGNAGGLSIDWNGKPVGPLGPHGQIRLLELSPSSFRFVALPAAKPPSPAAGL